MNETKSVGELARVAASRFRKLAEGLEVIAEEHARGRATVDGSTVAMSLMTMAFDDAEQALTTCVAAQLIASIQSKLGGAEPAPSADRTMS